MGEAHVLRFECLPQPYGIPEDDDPTIVELDGWQVSEVYDPDSRADIGPGLGDYRILLETTASSLAEFWKKRDLAFQIISDLDRVWVYATGQPLIPTHLTLAVVEAPEGWRTNAPEIEEAIRIQDGELVMGETSIISRHWLYTPEFPLGAALSALDALRSADTVTRALVDLHYEALKTGPGTCRLFLFAKALELVRALLPGRDDLAKEEQLPPEVRHELYQSLHWLFGVANNRIDIRHVVRWPEQPPELHSPLSTEERRDFSHDADLVVRAVATQSLGCDVPIVRRGDPAKRDGGDPAA